jgi:glutamine amidotransferase
MVERARRHCGRRAVTGTTVAVVDYGIGNLRSAQKALQHVGADARLTDDPAEIAAAAGVVLPGVGAFGRCLEALRASGLEPLVRRLADEAASGAGAPFLGICVGMQMLYEASDENPEARGLGVLDGAVRRLPSGVKHPQMQWNRLDLLDPESPLFESFGAAAWVYFVHSFAVESHRDAVATCDYGGPVVAAVQRGALWATQFHPEKSSHNGLRLLRNFVAAAARSRAAAGAEV